MTSNSLDCLFQPLRVGNLHLKNRVLMAPMATGFEMATMTRYLVARARGEVALVTTGETSVHPSGRTGLPNELTLETSDDIGPLAVLAAAVKRAGAAVVLQLNHAGRYSPGRKVGGRPVAPSPIMSGYTGETPRELSIGEVECLVSAFVNAAVRAREAGFDGVELLASSGYLMSQFLSPLTNHRTDRFGGTASARLRFVVSVVEEIRRRVGLDFNVSVKMDGDDGMEGGIDLDQARSLARALEDAGVDRLHVWGGWHESPRPMLPHFVQPGAFANLAAEIKREVAVPVSTAGRISSPYLAAQLVRDGKVDLIGIGRGLIADPNFVLKAREDRAKEIRPCIACCRCFDQIVGAVRRDDPLELRCQVNPMLGTEGEDVVPTQATSKRVAVVGAGPAGLEAARTAALRGHRVIVYERENRLGGMVNDATIPPDKDSLRWLVDYYAATLRGLSVEVRLGVPFDAETTTAERFDVVVLAAGAHVRPSAIPGVKRTNTLTAIEVLRSPARVGSSAVVIGGGLIGLEAAEYLARSGRKVTVIDMGQLAADMSLTARNGFLLRLRKVIRMLPSTRAVELKPGAVVVSDLRGHLKEISAETVVMATGLEVNRELVEQVAATGVEFYLAGSCKVPGQIGDAIADGFRTGCAI